MTIKDLEPKSVWTNFYDFSQVPRPSKHEEKAQEFLLEWGKKHNVAVERDETGNIIFRKPATPGYENRRGGHPSGAHGYGASEDCRNSA